MRHGLGPFWLTLLLLPTVLWLGCGDEESVGETGEPRVEAYFSQPSPGQPDETLDEVIIEMLEGAPEDAVVRAAFFTFSREEMAEAFAAALDRGVDVQMVLGNTSQHSGGGDWTAVSLLRDYLGEALTICRDGESNGGCMGDNIHHNKFVTFSEIGDGSKNVVVQSSGNPTNFQLTQYDNLVAVYNDAGLYEAFVSYWEDLKKQELNPTYDRVEEGELDITVYFSPYTQGDPIVEDLLQVDCSSGGEVYLAMAFFTNYRSPIAERLRQMDEEGCEVGVLLRHSEISSPGNQILGNLEQGEIDVGYFPQEEEIQLHSKYLIYRGAWGEESDKTHVVWTGSHNYTRSALYNNDEALLRIVDEDLHGEYLEDWSFLRPRAETLHP